MEKQSVLVIEDNALNMKLVRTLLEIGKYRVLEAVNAETGIRMAREHRPDLVLIDIQLPDMDGLEATRIIRKDPALKNTPVVAVTSYAMHGDEEEALEAGCTGFITKPLDTRSFLETISGYFKHDRASQGPGD
jgi:CheY-like chemotaxis protein